MEAKANSTAAGEPGPHFNPFRLAQSCARDPRQAAREFHEAVIQPDPALVVFFCSSEYDLGVLGGELSRLFGDIPLVGCTAYGEIGPSGYRRQGISGASFSSAACAAAAGRLDAIQAFAPAQARELVQALMRKLESRENPAGSCGTFGFMLIDGLSVREELVTHALQQTLGAIPLVGGSAGDDLRFVETHVYHDGLFRRDAAVVALVATPLPFRPFMAEHFAASEERLVVTAADAGRRVVKEINGLPAAQEYARLVGADPHDLDPMRFAVSPVVVRIEGVDYVRAIQKANPDGSLTFFCAIEEGLVFRLARDAGFVENLERTFGELRAALGPLQLVLGCDCVLRNVEMTRRGLTGRVEEIARRNRVVGFSSYGEQYGGVHVNQTFAGVAIGEGPKAPAA